MSNCLQAIIALHVGHRRHLAIESFPVNIKVRSGFRECYLGDRLLNRYSHNLLR